MEEENFLNTTSDSAGVISGDHTPRRKLSQAVWL